MMNFTKNKKVLFGLAVSLVLAMAVGSFALGEVQTPANTQVEAQSVAEANADTGDFVVSGGSYGTSNDYDFDTAGRVLYIHPQDAETEITISTGSSTTDRIEVTSAATIILAGVEIDRSSITTTEPAALTIVDDAAFDVNILLKDNTKNILKGATGQPDKRTIDGSPGIQKNGDAGVGTLTITGSTGENAGILEATGGYLVAGIGSSRDKSASNIKITGGIVTAEGTHAGAGIGGGSQGNGSNITITGGVVTATVGGGYGAGIGGGSGGNGSDITISGGTVKATGGYSAGAGIGGGSHGNGSDITISGGTVTAEGGTGITGIEGGAGIGGGYEGNGSDITISGGTVTATGGGYGVRIGGGAGIGGGYEGNGSDITISGGTVTATGGSGGAGIGGGAAGYDDQTEEYENGNGIDITIKDSEVEAYGNSGAGIGGGAYGNGRGINIINSTVKAVGSDADFQMQTTASAGIGGGVGGDGNKITISNSKVTATGGSGASFDAQGMYVEYTSAAAIGGGCGVLNNGEWTVNPGTGSENKIDDSSILIAKGGNDGDSYSIETLQGFDEDSAQGIAFIQKTDSEVNEGTVYGNTVLKNDFTMPKSATLNIPQNNSLTINASKTLTVPDGSVLTNDGTLTIKGTLTCTDTGKVETLLNYDFQGGDIVEANDDNHILYQDASGVNQYENLPDATKEGCDFDGWYTKEKGQGTNVENGNDILLNEHTLYANWIAEPEPTPTPPTPTPPGPEPEPTPTPEPIPDPSVNPDGDGSGSSSKTSDPFMGGMALALLGVATTGAVLVRKRK